MNCIVIAKLIGILSGDISENQSKVDFYNLDCNSDIHSVIVQNDKFVEIDVIKINKDLSYNIKIKG